MNDPKQSPSPNRRWDGWTRYPDTKVNRWFNEIGEKLIEAQFRCNNQIKALKNNDNTGKFAPNHQTSFTDTLWRALNMLWRALTRFLDVAFLGLAGLFFCISVVLSVFPWFMLAIVFFAFFAVAVLFWHVLWQEMWGFWPAIIADVLIIFYVISDAKSKKDEGATPAVKEKGIDLTDFALGWMFSRLFK
jgi:hypothetical protein